MAGVKRAAVAFLAALVLTTASCSEEDPDEAYCEVVRREQKVLDDLAGQPRGTDVLTPLSESLQRLQDAAPPELEDEYATVVNAYEGLVDAVERAGVDPAKVRGGKLPADLDPATKRTLRQTAAQVAAPRVTDATLGIEDHAQQVCHVDLQG